MKRFKNAPLLGFDGEKIKVPIKKPGTENEVMIGEDFKSILQCLVLNAPPPTFKTQNDSIQAMRLMQALDHLQDGFIEIEEGVHDWLKEKAVEVTPQIFRINGNIVYEHIREGFEKPNQPKEKGEKS